ncbi:hypothetical protein BDN70DRAFT_820006, partial [Pholiota conissans]
MFTRPAKKVKVNHYHDRVPIEDDFEVVHSRSSGLSTRNLAIETPRSPQKGRTTWVVGSTWAPEDDLDLALDETSQFFEEEMLAEVFESGPSRVEAHEKKRTRSRTSVSNVLIFAHVCHSYIVHSTQTRPHVFWKEQHRNLQKWVDGTFVKVSLKSLGLEVHLNHASMRCPAPVACHQDLRIIHTNGIHDVALSYCGCHRAIPRHIQLLRRGLYPASQITTRICATFQLLRLLHILSLTSKASTYDLYRALERLTDNVGGRDNRSRYRPLLRMGLQWRHLKMLKRGGRGHDQAGVAATKDGELAIRCPSCPHPGINLPEDWAEAPQERRFLYSLLVCLDANFRLKNQLVSNYSSDPGLGTGWAYMIRRESYEKYVLSQVDGNDLSTCVGFLALVQALTRFSRGMRYTGVGGAFCGRGEMILPNGIGNLQKGERYANMDYIFASAIRLLDALTITVSYDIACQWFKNLQERMKQWPSELRIATNVETRPLIPKFHEPAHHEKDHEQFSFNLVNGIGQSDGEVPERVWAGHNGLGGSTKTHGPGSRQDILDDHFGFWNWQKYASMAERNRQVEAHRGFTDSLPPAMVAEWEQMCVVWDANKYPKTAPNPFTIGGKRISKANVREQLAKEEQMRAEQVPPIHSTGPSAWLAMGLELEESQYSLRTIYIPGLLQYLADVGIGGMPQWDADPNAEEVDLFLPSRLLSTRREKACVDGLPETEARLRTAQCFDALDSLRRTLRLKTRMVQFKNRNIRGQKQSTRSRALIDRVHQRALASVSKYRAAREALFAISGPGSWEDALLPLLNADVRSYADPERQRDKTGRKGIWEDGMEPASSEVGEDAGEIPSISNRSRRDGTGRTRQTASWIWRTGQINIGSGEGDDDVLRSEWARSRARVHRCKEEVNLLLEEMRRVLQFLDWRAKWWDSRQQPRIGVAADLQEGLKAFAIDQASIQRQLSTTFQAIWKTPLNLVDDNQSSIDDDEDEDGNGSDHGGGDEDGNEDGDEEEEDDD